MRYICAEASAKTGSDYQIIFVDGWIGKGAIAQELMKSVSFELTKFCECLSYNINPHLYTVSDPGFIESSEFCGTREDFMIPSACLNATVNGLFSRTIRNELIGKDDFDGAVYYPELEEHDLSLKFIDTIMDEVRKSPKFNNISGSYVVERIMEDYNVNDRNKIKPGIGETIRVLLRRVPDKILIDPKYEHSNELKPVLRLCDEKSVTIEYVNRIENYLGNYKCAGIIKEMSDL